MLNVDAEELIGSLGMAWFHNLSTFGALSDKAIVSLLENGQILQLEQGEVLCQYGMEVTGFTVVLKGEIAFYKHFSGQDILTRHFINGEQIGFDAMLAMIPYSGTEVAHIRTLVVKISSAQFFDMHIEFSDDFGLFMINLARELSREIAQLEEVIGESTGWSFSSDD